MSFVRSGRPPSEDTHPPYHKPPPPSREGRDPSSRATTPRDPAYANQAQANLGRKRSDSTLGGGARGDLAPPGHYPQPHTGANAHINSERARAGYPPLAEQDRYIQPRREEGDRGGMRPPAGHYETREGRRGHNDKDAGQGSEGRMTPVWNDDAEWPRLGHAPPPHPSRQNDAWGDTHPAAYDQPGVHRAPPRHLSPAPPPSSHRQPTPPVPVDSPLRQQEGSGDGFAGSLPVIAMAKPGNIRSNGVNQIVPTKQRAWGQGLPVEDKLSAPAHNDGRSDGHGGRRSNSAQPRHGVESDTRPPSRAQPSPQVQAQASNAQEVDDGGWGERTVQPPRAQPPKNAPADDDGGWGDQTTHRPRPASPRAPPRAPSPLPPLVVKPRRQPQGPPSHGGDWEDKNGQVKRWAASVPPIAPDAPPSPPPRHRTREYDAESTHGRRLSEEIANTNIPAVTAYYSADEGGDEGDGGKPHETPAADETPALTTRTTSPAAADEEPVPLDRPRGRTTPKPSARAQPPGPPPPPPPVQSIPPILTTSVTDKQESSRDWGRRRGGRDRDGEGRRDWWRRDPHPMFSLSWADRRVVVVFPFPIKNDYIKNTMYQHFSKYGTMRGAFHYDSAGDNTTKAIVVFEDKESIDKIFADPDSKRCLFRSSPLVQATEITIDILHSSAANLERTVFIRVTGARSEEEAISRQLSFTPTPQDTLARDELWPIHQAVLPLSVCVDLIPVRPRNYVPPSGGVRWSVRVRDRPWPMLVRQTIEKTGMEPRLVAEVPTGPDDSERDFVPRIVDCLAEVTNIFPPTAAGQGWLITVTGMGDGRHLMTEIAKIPGFFSRWADERDGLYTADGSSDRYASTTGGESPLARLQNELKGRSAVAPYVAVASERGMTPSLGKVQGQAGPSGQGVEGAQSVEEEKKEKGEKAEKESVADGVKSIKSGKSAGSQETAQESVPETSRESGHEADGETENEGQTSPEKESVRGFTKAASDHTPTAPASAHQASLVATPVATPLPTPLPTTTVNVDPPTPTPRTPPPPPQAQARDDPEAAIPGKIFNSPNHPHLRRTMMHTYRGRPVSVSTDPETGESRYTDEAAVFVGRLAKSAETEATIFRRFSKYGKIYNIEYHPHMTAPQMNYSTARVLYRNRDSASKAIAGENGAVSEGSFLKVEHRKVLPMEVVTKMMYIDPIGRAISPSLVSQVSPRPPFAPEPTLHEPGPAPHYQPAPLPHPYMPMMPAAPMPPPMPFLHQMGMHMYPPPHPLGLGNSPHPMVPGSMASISPSVHAGALPQLSQMPMSPALSMGPQQSIVAMQGVMGMAGGVHYPYNMPMPILSWGYGYMPPTSTATNTQAYFTPQQPPFASFSPPATTYNHNETAPSPSVRSTNLGSAAPPPSNTPSAAVSSTEPEVTISPEYLSRLGLMMQGLNSNKLKPVGYKEEGGMIKAVFDPEELKDYYAKTGLPPPSEEDPSSRPSQREEVVMRERMEPQVMLLPISTGGHDPVPGPASALAAGASYGRRASMTHPLPPKPTLRRVPSESSLPSPSRSRASPRAPAKAAHPAPEPQSPGQFSVATEAWHTQQLGQALDQAFSGARLQAAPPAQMSGMSAAVPPGGPGYGTPQRAPGLWIPPNHPIPPQWHETGAPAWYPFPLPPLDQPQTTGLGSTGLQPGYSQAQPAAYRGDGPSDAPGAWPPQGQPPQYAEPSVWGGHPPRQREQARWRDGAPKDLGRPPASERGEWQEKRGERTRNPKSPGERERGGERGGRDGERRGDRRERERERDGGRGGGGRGAGGEGRGDGGRDKGHERRPPRDLHERIEEGSKWKDDVPRGSGKTRARGEREVKPEKGAMAPAVAAVATTGGEEDTGGW
ncbi:hypothetical protein IAT38_002650 [Cryptococcus sp. DSM 104549]